MYATHCIISTAIYKIKVSTHVWKCRKKTMLSVTMNSLNSGVCEKGIESKKFHCRKNK